MQIGQPSSVKSSASTTRSVGSGNSTTGASEHLLKKKNIDIMGMNKINFFIDELYKNKPVCQYEISVFKDLGGDRVTP
jgi:hypothetical protein